MNIINFKIEIRKSLPFIIRGNTKVNILLIDLPCRLPFTSPTLALLYLRSVLKQNKIRSQYIDLSQLLWKHLLSKESLQSVLEHLAAQKGIVSRIVYALVKKRVETYLINYEKIFRSLDEDYNKTNLLSDKNRKRMFVILIDMLVFSSLIYKENIVYKFTITFFLYHFLFRFLCLYLKKRISYRSLNEILEKGLIDKGIEKYKYCGISVSYKINYHHFKRVSSIIRRLNPSVKIITGGAHLTGMVELKQFSEDDFIHLDYIIIHEGEKAIVDLMNHLNRKEGCINNIKNISNLVHLDPNTNKIVKNDTEIMHNLNDLPAPDYSGIELKNYYMNYQFCYEIARGCYWKKCAFCAHPYFFDHFGVTYRQKTPDKITSDLLELNRQFEGKNAYCWLICDEITPKMADSMCRRFIEAGLKMHWIVFARFEKQFTRNLLSLMRKAGCIRLMMGLETLDQKLSRYIRKGIDIKEAKRILIDCDREEVDVNICLMFGLPGEKPLATLKNAWYMLKNLYRLFFHFELSIHELSYFSDFLVNAPNYHITNIRLLEDGTMDYTSKNDYYRRYVSVLIAYLLRLVYMLYRPYDIYNYFRISF